MRVRSGLCFIPLSYARERSRNIIQAVPETLADTIVYAAKGHGALVSGANGSKRQELAPGDWALIPAYAEHQEVNDSDEDVVWIITRGGRNPVVQNLEAWSTD
jgi:uncharacterized RmlC-like cupin family protein